MIFSFWVNNPFNAMLNKPFINKYISVHCVPVGHRSPLKPVHDSVICRRNSE